MSARWLMVPDEPVLIGAGRSLVQSWPMVGPVWAVLSVAEMSEGWVVVSGEVVGCVLVVLSIASDSGAFVAISGSDIVACWFKGVDNAIAQLAE